MKMPKIQYANFFQRSEFFSEHLKIFQNSDSFSKNVNFFQKYEIFQTSEIFLLQHLNFFRPGQFSLSLRLHVSCLKTALPNRPVGATVEEWVRLGKSLQQEIPEYLILVYNISLLNQQRFNMPLWVVEWCPVKHKKLF